MKFVLTALFLLGLQPNANASFQSEDQRLENCLSIYQKMTVEKINSLTRQHGGAQSIDTAQINLNSVEFWSSGIEFQTADGLNCKTEGFDVSTPANRCASAFSIRYATCSAFDSNGNYIVLSSKNR